MPNLPISGLNASAANLTATDLLPVVQTPGVGPVKMTGLQIKTYIVGNGSVSIASGKTLTASNSLTLAGTDGTTLTGPGSSTTLAGLSIAQVFTKAQTFQPDSDAQAGTFRRNSSGQTANVIEVQTEANGFLAGFDKAGILTLGAATRQTGTLKLAGTTSGTVSLSVADAAGTWTMKLPATAGNSGEFLQTDGSGNTTWAAGGGGITIGTTTITSGTTTRLLYDNGGVVGEALLRYSAANLALGDVDASSAVAQSISVQNVVAGTSNTAGANLTIKGSQGTGTGAGGSIIFQVAPAGTTGTAVNALATALTIASDKSATFAGYVYIAPSNKLVLAGSSYGISLDGTIAGANATLAYDGTYVNFYISNGFRASISGSALRLDSAHQFGWTSSGSNAGTFDTILVRDAADTLALRRSTNAQKLSIYNTYTSGTSYERYDIDWITTANTVLVGPTKGSGGGTQRTQRLQYLEDGGSGSTTPSLGTTCPAASATVKSWIKVITSDGTTAYVPCWA